MAGLSASAAAAPHGPRKARAAAMQPANLVCEYLRNPLGIDETQPRLSWESTPVDAEARGLRQTAYQVVVASELERLEPGRADLWDSGRVETDQSVHVEYGGKPLRSRARCYWKVRVWDQEVKESAWSAPAHWSMGLLQPSDWHGKWIGLDEPAGSRAEKNVMGAAQWIWFPEGQPDKAAPVGTRWFRRTFTLPADRSVKRAFLLFTGDNSVDCFVNDHKGGTAGNFHAATERDVTMRLHAGKNVLAASVKNEGSDPNPAGFIALLRVEFDQGAPMVIVTDSSWKVANNPATGWKEAGFDDAAWAAAQQLGPAGMAPWGEIAGPENRQLPARMLRREFAVEKKVRRATAYVSGLGLYEFYLNGSKVGDQVLSPGLTDYTKRALYVTFDVTKQLRKGANAAGIILGNGRFYAPRSSVRFRGIPPLLCAPRQRHRCCPRAPRRSGHRTPIYQGGGVTGPVLQLT